MILDALRVGNFKAVRDSGLVKLGALTVLIGNNGSGKSSFIEALETYRRVVLHGLDDAMQQFMGMEHVHYKRAKQESPISFQIRLLTQWGRSTLSMSVASDAARNRYSIVDESETGLPALAYARAGVAAGKIVPKRWQQGFSMLGGEPYRDVVELIEAWQFVSLAPDRMGFPLPQKRTGGAVRLARDGSNIAEFLLEFRERDGVAFQGLIDALAFVLPYATDLQPAVTSELERKAWLQLTEPDFKVPGWMLSTGTLRIVALLALLRHPTPPPLIVIEEIENGLDPRTLNMLVEEIRNAIELGKTQVIATTHSPYLLDLLALEHILLVERDASGEPAFFRPATDKALAAWRDRFAPGQLYLMDRLHLPARKASARG